MTNKLLIIILGVLSLSCLLVFIYQHINQEAPSQDYYPTSTATYMGFVKMGVFPNTPTRTPTDKDINTKVAATSPEGKVYVLFESRTWETLDYGKTFWVRVQ